MAKKFRLKNVGHCWQVQARVYFFFWMNVGPVHQDHNTASTAVKMANYVEAVNKQLGYD